MSCEPLIDANEAAKLLGIHPRTIKIMAAEGKLPGLKIGSVWRFRESALDNWISEQLKCSTPCVAAQSGKGNFR